MRRHIVGGRLSRTARRFSSSEKAATAVEFALIAPPFLALVLAIFQIALVFLTHLRLEYEVTRLSRQIRTGYFAPYPPGFLTPGTVKTDLCTGESSSVFNCDDDDGDEEDEYANRFFVDIRPLPADGNVGWPVNGQGEFEGTETFIPGAPGAIIFVRVLYKQQLILGRYLPGLANMSNGDRLLVSSAAFRNEPFGP